MTVGKATALTAGFIGAVGLGIAIGPAVTGHTTEPTVVSRAEITPAPALPPAPAPVARAVTRPAKTKAEVQIAALSATAPALHDRLKPLMNRGTRMELAAAGFADAEQFATVAHAARNTEVPFVILKHHVLEEGRTLTEAIRASKPEADAAGEARRAREAARADIESL